MNSSTGQDEVLVIRPSDKGIQNLKKKIKEVIHYGADMISVITKLNPILRGWAEHKRISPQTRRYFFEIDHYV